MGNKISFLREMHDLEIEFDYAQMFGNIMNPRAFVVHSAYNLFERRADVIKAIQYWIKRHALLQSKIVRFILRKPRGHYFVYTPQKVLEQLDNVKFIRFTGSDKKNCWKLLLENELTRSFTIGSKILWRLFILELDKGEDGSFKYCFLFHIHHNITDRMIEL